MQVGFVLQSVTTAGPAIGTDTKRGVRVPLPSLGRWAARLAKPLSGVASAAVAGAFLIHSFGLQQMLTAASSANLWLLAGAMALGAVIQVVRAQRTLCLFGKNRQVSLFQSFAAMVVGHGIGDLVPLAPGGPVLRAVLTQRLTRIPVALSAGVYMVEGMLDVLTPALLIPYLLFVVPIPAWTRWVLAGVLAQAAVLLAILVVLAIRPRVRLARRLPFISAPRLVLRARQLGEGLRALSAGGPRQSVLIAAFSVLVLALSAGQIALFLRAFALTPSANGLLLLLVVMLSSGSIPFKIPALGTISAAAALPVAGIHGPNVGGYLLTSQFLLSSETLALGILVIGWWFVRGTGAFAGVKSRKAQSPSIPVLGIPRRKYSIHFPSVRDVYPLKPSHVGREPPFSQRASRGLPQVSPT